MSSASDNIKESIRERFSKFLSEQKSGQISDLLHQIESNQWEAYFFGGTPRAAIAAEKNSPRDYDIVFSDKHFEKFSKYAESIGGQRNRFGGYKIKINGTHVDAWSLSDTWAFRERQVGDVSFENLQRTVPFNIDSFLIEIFPQRNEQIRRVFCDGYLNAIESRLLQIVLKNNPFPSLCLVRAVRFSHSFELKWSQELSGWMYDILKEVSCEQLIQIQLSHYDEVTYNRDYWRLLRGELESFLKDNSASFAPPTSP